MDQNRPLTAEEIRHLDSIDGVADNRIRGVDAGSFYRDASKSTKEGEWEVRDGKHYRRDYYASQTPSAPSQPFIPPSSTNSSSAQSFLPPIEAATVTCTSPATTAQQQQSLIEQLLRERAELFQHVQFLGEKVNSLEQAVSQPFAVIPPEFPVYAPAFTPPFFGGVPPPQWAQLSPTVVQHSVPLKQERSNGDAAAAESARYAAAAAAAAVTAAAAKPNVTSEGSVLVQQHADVSYAPFAGSPEFSAGFAFPPFGHPVATVVEGAPFYQYLDATPSAVTYTVQPPILSAPTLAGPVLVEGGAWGAAPSAVVSAPFLYW